MKILVLSDLHLESAKFAPGVEEGVDVVVFGNDIAPRLRGLQDISLQGGRVWTLVGRNGDDLV